MADNILLALNDVSVRIGKAYLLENINFCVRKGEIICILGRNGVGKSTLLKTILGIHRFKGQIMIDGVQVSTLSARQRATKIAYVPQKCHIIFPFKVIEVVMMGRFVKQKWFYTRADRIRAIEVLEQLSIAHLSEQVFTTLSGGQQQLVLIARSFAQECEILLLDEPLSALDLSRTFALLEILRKCGKTVLLTSHHPEQCAIANKILMLKNAKVLTFGKREEVLNTEMIKQLYDVDCLAVPLPNGGVYFVSQ